MRSVNIEGRVSEAPRYAHNVDTDEQVAVFQVIADNRKIQVVCRGELAKNVSLSLYVGDAVLVYGVVQHLPSGYRCVAQFVSHDLHYGSTIYKEDTGWLVPAITLA
jgi:hypothetical protein